MRPDAPLLVTEALLRGVAGIAGGTGEPPVPLDEKTWLETIRLASAHLVLPALADGLETAGPEWHIGDDARTYLEVMRDANRQRNGAIKAALVDIIRRLQQAGIDPLAVKGGAFLALDRAAAPWRYLGDIDLIVPAIELSRGVETLAGLGYRSAGNGYDPSRDAHAPAMLGPDDMTIVELHSRPFADAHWPELETALQADARTVLAGGVAIRIPSPEARAAYLMLHSQEHHGYHAQGRLLLRDVLDLAMLGQGPDGLVFQSALRLVSGPAQTRALAFLAAAAEFGIETPGIIFDQPQKAWSRRARNRLAGPLVHRQLTGTLGLARYELGRLIRDRRRTFRLATSLTNPAVIGRKLLRKLDKLRDSVSG